MIQKAFILAIGLLLTVQPCYSLAFKFQGSITRSNSPTLTATHSITGLVSDCRWIIRLESKTGPASYSEASYDGVHSYFFAPFRNPSDRGVNTSVAMIEPSPLPDEDATDIIPVWVALCSGCYFKELPSDKMPILLSLGGDRKLRTSSPPIEWRVEKSQHQTAPHFLKDLKLYTDGKSYAFSPTGQTVITQDDPPYDKGYLRHSFKVLKETNVNGIPFPEEFVFQSNLPSRGKATPDVRTLLWFFGKIESVEFVEPSVAHVFTPVTDGRALTEDRRFPNDSPGSHYLNTGTGTWAQANQPAFRIPESGPSEKETVESSLTSRQFLIILAIIISSLLLLRSLQKPQ